MKYLLITFMLVGCSAQVLKSQASQVKIVREMPKGCKNLGDVYGSQGNVITGAWTSNENLEIGAKNDLKNKTSDLGGNVASILNQSAGTNLYGAKQNASLNAIAYVCPEQIYTQL